MTERAHHSPEHQTQSGQRFLTPRGFADVSPSAAFAGNTYLEVNWLSNDEWWVGWVNRHAQQEAESSTPLLPIAVFQTGRDGSLITRDFGKIGKIRKKPKGLEITVGTPYVVEKLEETYLGMKDRGVWKLEAVREATHEDYLPHLQARAANGEGRRFCEVTFYIGDRGRLIGNIRVNDDGSDNWDQDGTIVRIDSDLPQEVKDRVLDGDRWIGEITEYPGSYIFKPHLPAVLWDHYRIRMDSGKPVVMQQRFNGLEAWSAPSSMPIDNPLMVAEYLRILPPTQQAILARLWDIYWAKETKRQEEEASYEEQMGLAKIASWEGYMRGTIGVERESESEEESGYPSAIQRKVVRVHGKKHTERFVVDPDASAEDAMREYDGNWNAYTAAEWLAIMEDDQTFLEYLINQEGIRVQPGLISGVRPKNTFIDVIGLARTEGRYRPNGNPWGREPVARDQFEFNMDYKARVEEFESDALKIVAQFSPSLYEKTTGIHDEVAVNGWLPETSYHFGYLLENADVDFKEDVQKLPEHVKERILRIVQGKLAELRKPDWTEHGEGESVRWLAGKRWETPEAETTESASHEGAQEA